MFTGGGLGNRYRRETGKDPSDPHNELDLNRYAMREAAKGGWGPWHGARKLGITGHMGMGRPRRAAPGVHPAAGAIQALNGASVTPLVDTKHLERTAALLDHIHDRIGSINSGGVGARAGSYRTAMSGSFTVDHWRRSG